MAFISGSVPIGTTDTDIFTCPATLNGAVVLGITNISASSATYTLKHYKQSTGTTTTIASTVTVAARTPTKYPVPIAIEAGDILQMSANAGSAIVATPTPTVSAVAPAATGFTPKGAWSAVATYATNDIVELDGTSYISLQDDNLNQDPATVTAYWMINAEKGDPGAGVGDLISTNNLSDLDDVDIARTNLGATAVGEAVFIATDAAAAQTAIGGTTVGKAVFVATDAAAARSAIAVRELLTADRTYYVRTDGSDSNNGLANTSGGAFLTVQKAIDTAATLDMSIYNVTIQLAAGTYSTTTGNVLRSAVGAGKIIVLGDETTPSNVVVTTSGAMVSTNHANFFARGVRTTYSIRGVQMKSTASGNPVGIGVQGGSAVEFQAVDFNTGFVQQIRTADPGSVALGTGAGYTISGGAGIHANGSNLSSIQFNSDSNGSYTVTITGTPAFTTFVNSSNIGYVSAITTAYSGSATGARYSAINNSVINTVGGGPNAFPGNSAGSVASGGIYS